MRDNLAIVNEIARLRSWLESRFLERSDEIICSLLALCAGEHVLFLGPPGTAKSQLARSVCEAVDGSFFYYLMTRFTTPEEVFGPLSLKALQEDDFSRQIEGYLPTAHIAFLDEIFKANSSILNSFLTVLNERKFHNGRHAIDVPLIAAFGASNELPEDDDNLAALYDRFLFRCVVSPIREEENFRAMLFGNGCTGDLPLRLTVDQIRRVQESAKSVAIDDSVQRIILQARKELGERHIDVSDRRWKKMVDALRAAAAAAGRDSVDGSMVVLLKHMAWVRPGQREDVQSLLIDLIITGGESLEKLSRDVTDLCELLLRTLDRPFPHLVRCYDCGELLSSSKTLASHDSVHPDHRFFDPHRTGVSMRFMRYDQLLATLREEYGWDFVAGPAGRKRECQQEQSALRSRYERTMARVVDDMGRLERQLAGNFWVSDRDAAAIMSRHAARQRTMSQIGDGLCAIDIMLEWVAD
jgi:MoxR-like ATPase